MRFVHGMNSGNGKTTATEYTALHCINAYLKNMFFTNYVIHINPKLISPFIYKNIYMPIKFTMRHFEACSSFLSNTLRQQKVSDNLYKIP